MAYRSAAGIALATAFLLCWVIGAIIACFKPEGMARALLAMAIGQASSAGITVKAGMAPANTAYEILGINGLFAALWLLSAWLFRNAGRE